eukprot:scaffold222540_cov18-Tisochrysis_lutea.AAC.1
MRGRCCAGCAAQGASPDHCERWLCGCALRAAALWGLRSPASAVDPMGGASKGAEGGAEGGWAAPLLSGNSIGAEGGGEGGLTLALLCGHAAVAAEESVAKGRDKCGNGAEGGAVGLDESRCCAKDAVLKVRQRAQDGQGNAARRLAQVAGRRARVGRGALPGGW